MAPPLSKPFVTKAGLTVALNKKPGRPRHSVVSGRDVDTSHAPAAGPSTPDSLPPFERLEMLDLFTIGEWADRLSWQPFQEGVEIYRLHGDGKTGLTSVLLRFLKNGKVPIHEHVGCEHVLILSGQQKDQNSLARAGTLMINPNGTRHSVVGEAGCIALAIYENPVNFFDKKK
jgi:quercetin dioxygenase-like cupin family protein